MPVASLLAQQLGGMRVRSAKPVPAARVPAPVPVASVQTPGVSVPVLPVSVAPVAAARTVLQQAAQSVKSIALSERDTHKVLSFTLTDGTVETVVVESTADVEAKVAELAVKIADLQAQAAGVATRLDAIEKVI